MFFTYFFNINSKPTDLRLEYHLQAPYDHGNPLTPANAGAGDAQLLIHADEGVDQGGQDLHPRGADGVPQSDGAATGIELLHIEGHLAVAGQDLGRKRLVDLDQIHIVKG